MRFIAFYLPQYYPIPQNDKWWGKGFTEWTNVTKARPLFRGHYQPRFPADLGYYDLRVGETREAQAQLAQEYGIEGFCYWHYWFGGKRKLLDRPLREVIESKQPDFPFCIAWANETWSGIWHGSPDKVLMHQFYLGVKDYQDFFYDSLNILSDPRYIKIDDKPVFIIYRPLNIPDCKIFVETWNNLAIQNGLKGIYFLGIHALPNIDPKDLGLDGIIFSREVLLRYPSKTSLYNKVTAKLNHYMKRPNHVYNYEKATKSFLVTDKLSYEHYPVAIPNWDNSARSGLNSFILHNSTPELFRKHLSQAARMVSERVDDKKVVFIKSWNEWAEGNYLEPDKKFGKQYLEMVKSVKNMFI